MNKQFKGENVPSQENIEDKKIDFQKLDEEASRLKDEIDELEMKTEDENLSEEERKKIHEEIIEKRNKRLALTNKAIEELEKESREEYHVLNEKGEPVEVMQLSSGVGEEFYVEVISDSEQKILPYKKLVKTEEGWGEEVEPGKIMQIQEQNIKVGKVDRENKTITFE